jgi:predicted kinase
MPCVHLIVGNVGSGKTTYAIALANRLGAIRFSLDEWMVALFRQDPTAKVDLQWRLDRIDRIEEQIWSLVTQLGARGMDVVLDLGLAKKKHRDRQWARAAALGLSVKLHFLDVDLPTRVDRVRKRNAEKHESFAFEVTDEMIRFMEGWFERPAAEELDGAEVVAP